MKGQVAHSFVCHCGLFFGSPARHLLKNDQIQFAGILYVQSLCCCSIPLPIGPQCALAF